MRSSAALSLLSLLATFPAAISPVEAQAAAPAAAPETKEARTPGALCAAVPGIDVFVGGHAHRGIESPYVHPKFASATTCGARPEAAPSRLK
jgi:2',3'-cyclic-nucleotide 2'-phosphodiesterase (5'-nucleotidase family)